MYIGEVSKDSGILGPGMEVQGVSTA